MWSFSIWGLTRYTVKMDSDFMGLATVCNISKMTFQNASVCLRFTPFVSDHICLSPSGFRFGTVWILFSNFSRDTDASQSEPSEMSPLEAHVRLSFTFLAAKLLISLYFHSIIRILIEKHLVGARGHWTRVCTYYSYIEATSEAWSRID